MEDHIAGNGHGVLKVPLNFVDNVLRRSPEKNSASLGVLAFPHEGKIFVSDLLNLEETALSSHIGLLEVIDPVDDRGASGTGDSVVVRLPHAAKSGDVGLHQEMLGEICICQPRMTSAPEGTNSYRKHPFR